MLTDAWMLLFHLCFAESLPGSCLLRKRVRPLLGTLLSRPVPLALRIYALVPFLLSWAGGVTRRPALPWPGLLSRIISLGWLESRFVRRSFSSMRPVSRIRGQDTLFCLLSRLLALCSWRFRCALCSTLGHAGLPAPPLLRTPLCLDANPLFCSSPPSRPTHSHPPLRTDCHRQGLLTK